MSINTIPTDKEIANISACISEGWELLPVYLSINEQMDVDGSRVYKIFHILRLWKRQKNETMKLLLKALQEAEYTMVVDRELLRKMFGYEKEVLSL
ncbi:hypothetical protein DPMN_164591 [Dreissena polymorpha]|uniref:Death domain-containing protein n=1 Tax=Dreissena polymorpha TaxID=45954 RepID=A0A9D4IVJ8_DREPO|nr:hypothetical protein DPMN_174669 [Dreissena polymorpha]KAH3786484.1 hypothetical protein DPMN_164591 [Dreissena polymorpha]